MFPHNPFASAQPVFDPAALARMVVSHGTAGEVEIHDIYPRKRAVFMFREHGPVTLFQQPEKEHSYVIGAAGAVATVFDVLTGTQVASLEADAPDRFAEHLALLAKLYAYALVVPAAEDAFTPLLANKYEPLRIHTGGMPGVIGFSMDAAGLARLVFALANAIASGRVQLRSKPLRQQCIEFRRNPDGTVDTGTSGHVWAAALAAYGLDLAPKPASPMKSIKGMELPGMRRRKPRPGF